MRVSSQVIINLTRVGTNDGGSQAACSFLQELAILGDTKNYKVIAFRETSAGILAKKLGYDCILIGRNIYERICLDFFCRKYFQKGQLCFTFFGVPWLRSKNYLVNVSGAADSNLYYPNLPFWKYYSYVIQLKKFLKDRARMFGYSRADHWVFETDALAKRAIDLAGYPESCVSVVKMSASTFVSPAKVDQRLKEEYNNRIGDGFSLLFLCGSNPNKRIIYVGPAIANVKANRMTESPVKVVTTLEPNTVYFRKIEKEFKDMGISDTWVNLGPIPFDHVSSLIDSCNVMCLFSVLESFSSNFTEAWMMKKPLLVSDVDWARSACGEAAIYVEPTNTAQISEAIVRLMQSSFQSELLSRYDSQLEKYPTAQERCSQYLEVLEKARIYGSIPMKKRKGIVKYECK